MTTSYLCRGNSLLSSRDGPELVAKRSALRLAGKAGGISYPGLSVKRAATLCEELTLARSIRERVDRGKADV
ncbi:hypothetical protein J4Q44_G00127170 [Coregonus suidteri]|uniref:Uncharacterized protein n=1 Tax=Coregonus suidteri TaxID=861788 RepID=A0AAN8R8A3_9TELE